MESNKVILDSVRAHKGFLKVSGQSKANDLGSKEFQDAFVLSMVGFIAVKLYEMGISGSVKYLNAICKIFMIKEVQKLFNDNPGFSWKYKHEFLNRCLKHYER